MEKIRLIERPEWKALQAHYKELRDISMRSLFRDDPGRAGRFSLMASDLFLDYSKNRITKETMRLLLALPEAVGLRRQLTLCFQG